LALRIVSGLTVKEIARAFLVSESAMEQRITRAKRRGAEADVAFRAPRPAERAQPLPPRAAEDHLPLNRRLFRAARRGPVGAAQRGAPLCEEAIRLSRLLLKLFQSEPEIMGLTALLLLQHARTPARLDADGNIILLEEQNRSRWDRKLISEGVALLEKAVRHH